MWRKIWQSKGENPQNRNLSVFDLMKIDGFDTSKDLDEKSWVAYAKHIADSAQINDNAAILEIGCGGGAFLKVLCEIFDGLDIYGLDYSSSLINIAKSVIDGTFYCDEANKIDAVFTHKRFDVILSNSVLNYFPSEKYAFEVIEKSATLLARGGNLAFLDLNDITMKEAYKAIRQGDMSDLEYSAKYEGLEHLFFSKSEIFDLISSLGFEKIIVENQRIEGYINNNCRFNVFAIAKI